MDHNTASVLQMLIGFGSLVIMTAVWRLTSWRGRGREAELKLAQERARQQELRIADLQRQNELLQRQVEWHGRLLETQDRALRQLGDSLPGEGAEGAAVGTDGAALR